MLDVITQAQMIQMLREVPEKGRYVVCVYTHNRTLCEEVCNRIMMWKRNCHIGGIVMEKEIKKIAILHCKKSGRVCTGAACFRAFYDRKKSFEQYEGQPVELSAYFDCNGCEADKLNDPGFTEKLERMKEEHVDRIHIGKCCLARCEQLNQMKKQWTGWVFLIVEGTH